MLISAPDVREWLTSRPGRFKPVTSHYKLENSKLNCLTPHIRWKRIWTPALRQMHENCLLRMCHHIVIEL
jgi:hypothetical protein